MLIAQALTTMKKVREQLNLYTVVAVTASETLTANTASVTFSFAHTDLAPNTFGTFAEVWSASTTTILSSAMTFDLDAGTATFSAVRTGSITVSEYSYFDWDNSKDSLIERLINSVSGMVQNYCGRDFIAETYDEFYSGLARPTIALRQYPVNKISSVMVDSAAYTAGTDYVTAVSTFLDRGFLVRESGWPWSGYSIGLVGEPTATIANVEVVYSAGYTLEPGSVRSLPWELEDVVISMISELYDKQSSGKARVVQMSQGQLSYTYSTASMLDGYSMVLDKFKRWGA